VLETILSVIAGVALVLAALVAALLFLALVWFLVVCVYVGAIAALAYALYWATKR
jgi:hypothetical protein